MFFAGAVQRHTVVESRRGAGMRGKHEGWYDRPSKEDASTQQQVLFFPPNNKRAPVHQLDGVLMTRGPKASGQFGGKFLNGLEFGDVGDLVGVPHASTVVQQG